MNTEKLPNSYSNHFTYFFSHASSKASENWLGQKKDLSYNQERSLARLCNNYKL